MKKIDVISVCNALVDILIQASDDDLTKLSLTKGVMHLVDHERQRAVLGILDQLHEPLNSVVLH